MLADSSQRINESLISISNVMRGLVDSSIREGMLRAVPDPVEARQLADVHARLLHRIRAVELALREFDADLLAFVARVVHARADPVRHVDARHFVVQELGVTERLQRQDADHERDRVS